VPVSDDLVANYLFREIMRVEGKVCERVEGGEGGCCIEVVTGGWCGGEGGCGGGGGGGFGSWIEWNVNVV